MLETATIAAAKITIISRLFILCSFVCIFPIADLNEKTRVGPPIYSKRASARSVSIEMMPMGTIEKFSINKPFCQCLGDLDI